MKRMITNVLVVAIMVLVVFGCVAPRQGMRPMTPVPAPNANMEMVMPQAGLVPVDIQNPSILSQEVWIFEGSAMVELVPDGRTGGWMFNRPAIASFRVGGANSERNWHEYVRIQLPRNANFVLASRTWNFWGAGWPEYYYFRTGPNPGVYEYTQVTPSYPRVYSAGLVTLREKAIAPFGSGPLHIEFTLDARPLGWAIRDGLTNAIYGR